MLQIRFLLTSFSKHLLTSGGKATGWIPEAEGSVHVEGKRWNMSVNTSATCVALALNTQSGMQSSLGAL